MTDSAVEAMFGAAPADIDLGADTRTGNDAAVVTLLVLATVALFLRIASRSVTRAGVKLDDWLMVLALVSNFSSPNRPRAHLTSRFGQEALRCGSARLAEKLAPKHSSAQLTVNS